MQGKDARFNGAGDDERPFRKVKGGWTPPRKDGGRR